jgi:hypothetical protein
MVSKPTGRSRGRPRKWRPPKPSREEKLAEKFLRDPDRFGVAMLEAMLAFEMASERHCALAIAALLVGVEGDPPHDHGDRIAMNYETKHTRVGATSGTLEGRASTLRVKQGRCRSAAERVWRKAMAGAFMRALGARDREAVKVVIVERVMASGERDPARAVLILWRMVDTLRVVVRSPEFSPKNVSTTAAG